MKDLPFDLSTLTRDKLRGVGIGLSSEVVHIVGTNIVAKIPSPRDVDDQKVEKRIYERLQGHPNILKYLGQSPPACTLLRSALLFEYHRRGSLMDCFSKLKILERSRWPFQAVSAVAYIHSKDVVHGDLGLHNFLLRDDGSLVLCDFAGSGLDDVPPNVSAGVRYLNPLFDTDYPSEIDDVFALGTVLYELDRGERLFDGRSDQEIRHRLNNKQFPDLSLLPSPLRQVIQKCWENPDYKTSCALIELQPQPLLIISPSFSGLLGLTVGFVGAVIIFKLTLRHWSRS